MLSSRKKVYADDLLMIIDSFKRRSSDILRKLGDDFVINQGLFLMTTSLFEDAIRELMRVVLLSYPEKLQSNSCTINKKQVCDIADEGYRVIIDNELYLLFRNGVRDQLECLLTIVSDKDKKKYNPEIIDVIDKISDVYLYRNSLIHNGGKADKNLLEKAIKYKVDSINPIRYNKSLIEKFIFDFIELLTMVADDVSIKYKQFNNTRLGRLRELWKTIFSSPIMQFDDYWYSDIDNDLITGIKYPNVEGALSSSEIVLLSIWRHQYYDCIKTKEFLICSINYDRIYKIYQGLDDVKFYHMQQEADSLGLFKKTSVHNNG